MGTIQTQSETSAQAPVAGSFQGRIYVAYLQSAFMGHYISETSEAPDVPPANMVGNPPNIPKANLIYLKEVAGDSASVTNK